MMVSVCMITYGHENYIEEAIKGVLMQEVNFEVELIIANDCSPDNTDNIIKEIQKSNKKGYWIKYLRQQENIGMTANMLFALQHCKGKFIAFCEGDDYWTDPLKLQKQVDYLLSNPDIRLIYTGYNIFIQNTGEINPSPPVNALTEVDEGYNDLMKNNFIGLLTVMADSEILLQAAEKLIGVLQNWSMVDYPLWLYISSRYKIAYIPEYTAVYRYLPVSASHSGSLIKNLQFLKNVFFIRLYFHKKIKRTFSKTLISIYFKFYYESYLYTYRKFKQKIYDNKIYDKKGC